MREHRNDESCAGRPRKRTRGIWLLRAALVASACAPLLRAGAEPAPLSGSAQTISGKFSGPVVLQSGRLTVGDRELKLEETLYLAIQSPEAAEAPTNALRMVNGEYWRANLLGLADQAVTVINPAMNRERRVGLESIAALEFSPEDTSPDMDRPETMYRREGAALPGTLVWIKNSDVAVQSLIGVIPLPRPSLVCYVLRQPGVDADGTLDELRLADGSLYRGVLGLQGDLITLRHYFIRTIKVRPDQVRYVSRCVPGIRWLSALPGKFEPGAVPLGTAVAPELIAHRPEAVASPCMQALRIQPATLLRYSVPASPSAWIFQATIAPRPSNVGDVQLEVRAGGSSLLQRSLAPTNKPESVALTLPAGKELEIAVACGERLAFPAAVDLCDPFIRAAE